MDHLLTEARNPASANLDELTPLELVRLMNAEDSQVAAAVGTQAEVIARAIEAIAERLQRGGRLIYAGAGTSGRLGVLDATECPPTFSAPPGQVMGIIAGGPRALTQAVEGAEDHPEFAEQDLRQINFQAGDVLVGIATSGRTPYVLGAVAYARSQGGLTIGFACNPGCELSGHVDLPITVAVGPEILSGSTRLKAGTATKLVLNLLSTGAMVRLGKTFGNLMVDLRATNQKLKARTNRIVRQLTGLAVMEADAVLERCGGELKTALVAQLCQVSPDEARRRLSQAGGQVRKALAGSVAQPAMPRHDLVLGIDGGGSHTVALLGRPDPADPRGWHLVGRGEAGPSNLAAVGVNRALAALDDAVNKAFSNAGLPRGAVTAACLGLAGAGRMQEQTIIKEWANRGRVADTVEVTGDAQLLLAAGTSDNWGVALVAGTGSMAFARAPDGRTTRVGGWGYLLGDEGSGYVLVLEALRRVAQAADGRQQATDLTQRFLAKLGLSEPRDLIGTVYHSGLDRAALAALATLVFQAAAAGDPSAAAIMRQGADDLAAMVKTAAAHLGLTSLPLALTGGLLLGSAGYREQLLSSLAKSGITTESVALVQEPAEGAVKLALIVSASHRVAETA